jgi:hypothetical protein
MGRKSNILNFKNSKLEIFQKNLPRFALVLLLKLYRRPFLTGLARLGFWVIRFLSWFFGFFKTLGFWVFGFLLYFSIFFQFFSSNRPNFQINRKLRVATEIGSTFFFAFD